MFHENFPNLLAPSRILAHSTRHINWLSIICTCVSRGFSNKYFNFPSNKTTCLSFKNSYTFRP